ncbi:MFS transporter [Sphingopyxis yananensis]|uniref:MFS transporter n=1 Tax=Sphingopyxis yananensis TaxID=2886687 RepID=UPI001D1044F2|nr:glycoside-pentoside-hexuronide (GPH):cation symporter [Sphingopyxis yananensis]MCC2600850.1 glycoside-pentoside-hexuronide (GPH):cation symporter [Sphingopyxis yananensis]
MAGEQQSSDASEKLGLGRVIAYGSGDLAFNLYFTFCSLFLLYFYTDVLGISPSVAGLIIMAALVWEGVTDPAMGIIASRTHSRFGSYRPYILYGAPFLALSFIAMFWPTGLQGPALALFCLVAHILFRTVYTVVNIPYVALSARMTTDSMDRSRLAGARMMFAILTGLLLAAATLPMVTKFGGGEDGFLRVSQIYALIATLVLLVCFARTHEQANVADTNHSNLRDMMVAVRRNRPFLLLLAATLIGSIGYTMGGKALLYYMKYHAGNENSITVGLTISLTAAALAMIPWVMVTRRTSKRAVWLCGVCLGSTANILIFAFAPKAGLFFYALLAINGVGNAAFVLSFWSMLPDTVEIGEWQSGVRAEGALVGFLAFTQKVALGLGTGMIGILLDLAGYQPNRTQSPETIGYIQAMTGLAPAVAAIMAGAIIAFYPLDNHTHNRLVRALSRRRTRSPLSASLL